MLVDQSLTVVHSQKPTYENLPCSSLSDRSRYSGRRSRKPINDEFRKFRSDGHARFAGLEFRRQGEFGSAVYPVDARRRGPRESIMSEQERWQVDSSAPEAYERYMVPTLFVPWAHDLLSRVAPQSGERVVDVACGTGIVARLAATLVGETGYVVGVDLNQAMLDVAGTQTSSPAATLEWYEADVNAMPCDDAAFDVALCQQGFQFFPDKAAALREIHRVLAPGGRFVLSVWRPLSQNPYQRLLGDALEKHLGSEAATGWRAACGLGDAETLRTLLTEAGFEDVHISIAIVTMRNPSLATFIPGQLAASPWAGAVAALDATAQSALLDDVISALQPYTDDDGLAVPTESHVVRARKL